MIRRLKGPFLMLVVLYVGLEIYTEGPHRAFGGRFSFLAAVENLPEEASDYVTRGQRVQTKVEGAMRQAESRYDFATDD